MYNEHTDRLMVSGYAAYGSLQYLLLTLPPTSPQELWLSHRKNTMLLDSNIIYISSVGLRYFLCTFDVSKNILPASCPSTSYVPKVIIALDLGSRLINVYNIIIMIHYMNKYISQPYLNIIKQIF